MDLNGFARRSFSAGVALCPASPIRPGLFTKTVRIMKLTVVLLFAVFLQVSAAGHAQTITLSHRDIPLQTLFKEIEKQSGYQFFFNDKLLEQAKNVSIDIRNASLEEALEICFRDQPVTYAIIEKMIIVKRRNEIIAPERPTETQPPGEIHGRITNAQGEPLAGANVIIKRTHRGTQTNAKGEFVLKNVQPDDVLGISFIGYQNLVIKIGGGSEFPLVMEVAKDELDKVVVQGYGTTTRRLATGNIGKVTAAEIEKQPVMNPFLALQGKIAGLDVVQTSGFASGPLKVEIRGRNVIGADPTHTFPSDPLYIIDGVPLTILETGGNSSYQTGSTGFIQTGVQFNGPAQGQSPLFNINPADIESIEVLKDADATAIYGSRASNGVILITTKKGKPGKTKFDLRIQEGITKVTRFWQLMSLSQYLNMRREAFKNDRMYGVVPDEGNAYDLLTWDTTRYTDWQKELYGGTGKTIDAQGSLSGGNAQTNFRLGIGYGHTTNILTVNGADQRGSLSFNLMHYSLDRRFGISFTGGYSLTQSDMINLPGNVLMAPNAPAIYDSTGKLNYTGWGGKFNNNQSRQAFPFSGLKQPYTSTTNFLNTNLIINYDVLRGLKLSSSFGYNNAQANQKQFNLIASQDPETQPLGSAYFGYNNNKNWIIEPQANYEAFVGKGKLSILAGTSLQQTNTQGIFIGGNGYTNDNLIWTISNAPTQSSTDVSGEYRYAAIYSRVTYNWENKYILNLNARRDGSSKFGSGKQYGNFGSLGVAWIFTEENWIKKYLKFLSYGKLRGSYGITGGDGIGDYKYLTRWNSLGTQPYNGIPSLRPQQFANPNFHWQTNKKLEAAINLGFLKDKFNIGVSYYRNRCGDQLISYPTPAFSGFTNVTANSPALVQNQGWEVTANINIINNQNFNWTIDFNTSFNNNKLLAFPNIGQSPFASTLVVGQPLNIVHLLHYTGVDPQTGQYAFQDKNHDGQINFDPNQAGDDSYVYNVNPKFFGGVGMNLSYKSVAVSMFFVVKKQIGRNSILQGQFPGTLSNQPADIAGHQWQNPGDIVTVARFSTNVQGSDSYYRNQSDGGYTDASYIRLSNLSISYSFPSAYIKKLGMQNCSVFLHSNNLFTITKFRGLDPETQNFGGMPPSRVIVGGLSFNF